MADDGDDDGVDLNEWEEAFRAAAEADDYAIFRDHLRRLGLPDEPLMLLDGTIQFVQMWNGFTSLARRDAFTSLLEMQTYDPALSSEAVYAYTFDLCGMAYARVLIESKYGTLDWSPLTDEERCHLEMEATDDLRFDYSEDELDIDFEFAPFDETFLFARVQEVYGDEDEVEDEVEDEEVQS
ncbi:MAG: hypothetical protein JWM11_3555 [Planctomycetaceae bacterium]|nr:hypothetical protein [Planctomycetaceae bacterium]